MNIIKLTHNNRRLTYQIRCTVEGCGNIQDFDNTSLVKATNSAIGVGWQRKIIDNKVHWQCPECVEELKTIARRNAKPLAKVNIYG